MRKSYLAINLYGVSGVTPLNPPLELERVGLVTSPANSFRVNDIAAVVPANWAGAASGPTYVWFRNGTPISGANSFSYVFQTADIGATITVSETRSNAGGSTTSVSLGIGPVVAGVTDTYDYLVANDTEFTQALQQVQAGQKIGLLPGNYAFRQIPYTTTNGASPEEVTPTLPANVTIKSTVRWGAKISQFNIANASNCMVDGVCFQDNGTQSSGYLGNLFGTCPNMRFTRCKFRGGDGRPGMNFVDVDPTLHYSPEYGGPGDWNRPIQYIADLAGLDSRSLRGSLMIDDCDFTDFVHGMKLVVTATIPNPGIQILGNRFGRIGYDFIGIGVYRTSSGAPQTLEICSNVFYDHYTQPQDRGNPHGDVIQYAGDDQGTKFSQPLPGLLIAGNIYFQRPGARGSPQRIFLSDVASGAPFWAPVIVDNLMISRVTSKGAVLSAPDDNSGVYSAYIANNTFLVNPTQNLAFDNEVYVHTDTSKVPPEVINPSQPSPATIKTVNDPLFPSKHFIDGNFTESITAEDWTAGLKGNITTGLGQNSSSYATWFDTTESQWLVMDSADKTLAGFKPKPAFAQFGAVRQTDDLESFLARWKEPLTRPYNTLQAFAGVADVPNTLPNTSITSPPAYCFAWGGRPFSVGANLEWRTTSDYAGTTVVQNWTTSPGTVQHGNYLWLRTTSSASTATTVTRTYTLDGLTSNWYVTTASTNDWPQVTMDGTAYWTKSDNAVITTDGPRGTMFLRIKYTGAPDNNKTLYSGHGLTLSLVTTGILRISFATIGGRVDTDRSVTDGQWHDVLFSWDVSQTDQADGRRVFIDGIDRTAQTALWSGGPGKVVSYGSTSAATFGGTATVAQRYNRDFGAFWYLPNTRLDLSSALVRSKFLVENIGTNGQGPTGSAPPIFVTGTASQWNDGGGINWGTAAKFVKTAGNSPTDISGPTWV